MSRSWCWTYFSEEPLEEILDKAEKLKHHRFSVAQRECCPESGRIHVQGYTEFGTAVRMASLRNCFPGVHCEKRKGDRDQARDYCRKSESRSTSDHSGPAERGSWKSGGQGARNDLEAVRVAIRGGTSELDIADGYFNQWVRYRRSFQIYRSLVEKVRSEPTELHILWGEPGTGKTRSVWESGLSVYAVPQPNGGSVWFDGYQGEEAVLLDDFYGWIPLHLLLKLADRYPLQVPVKGGMVNFSSKRLYVTSNKSWEDWYNWAEFGSALRGAFQRRIVKCTHFNAINAIN